MIDARSAPLRAPAQRESYEATSIREQLAFELEGALLSANWYFHLFHDTTNIERARLAVRTQLSREATPTGLSQIEI